MDINGENKLNLTSEITSPASGPAFTPNGKQIIFRSKAEYPTAQIFSINIDGSGLKNLSNNDLRAFFHDVSRDGAKIVFGDVR